MCVWVCVCVCVWVCVWVCVGVGVGVCVSVGSVGQLGVGTNNNNIHTCTCMYLL